MSKTTAKRVILIGVGGASCSGKTLLAKHLRNILPSGSIIVHQDDFVPPIEQVPYSSRYPSIQDWDDPPTCIQWPEFRSAIAHIKATGTLPPLHSSHDHLNKQVEVSVDEKIKDVWRSKFSELSQRFEGEELIFFLIDGFVLYWDPEIVDALDVRLFLRVPHDILKRRREERQVYVLQNPDDAAAGGVWVDPPKYFEQIVYPGYIEAHKHIFEDEDIEHGDIRKGWGKDGKDLIVLTPGDGAGEMTKAVEQSCEAIMKACNRGVGSIC